MWSPIPIPQSVEGITRQWLTTALRQKRPDILVNQMDVLKSLGGACTKLRVSVVTNDPDFPETVIVKGCFESHQAEMLSVQYREALIYSRVVPFLDNVETVDCFFVQADETLGSALIMEDLDLRGVSCRNAIDPISSYELAADYLRNLAHLHARWWNSPELGDDGLFGCLGRAENLLIPRSDNALTDPAVFAQAIRKPRAACLSRTILDAPRLLRAFNRLKEEHRHGPLTLTHGDMHPSNLFTTSDGRGGLFDWTSLRVCWAQDVAYFIGGNLDPVHRREWEKPLLQHYLSELASLQVAGPRFEDAWRSYRCWMMWGIYVWLFNIPEYHSEENVTAMTARFGTALVDHATLNLLAPEDPTP